MPRYQQLDETKLSDAQRRIWNECKSGPRGSVPPPVHVWLKSPGLADNAHKLGAHVRFGTQFTQKQTEIAILMTARYWTAQFEWAAHVRLARNAGVPQEVIDAIAERRTPSFTDPDDQLVYDFCQDYYDDHRVDDSTYNRVVARFGEQGIVDLAGLIGYYSFVSVTLNTFEVPTPPDAKLLEK
ncbi:MAG TPA: carboxymuconolactone decarboxylase family protein [Stellaceae bacterium]|jgi:4-carboxymuconolactone decarboxylase|nr:carboxymuconolactone decarboxylase family protein [Stellaceae bacterium]